MENLSHRLLEDGAQARAVVGLPISAPARRAGAFRGRRAADLPKLAEVVAAIGDAALALGPQLAALEVNPLWLRGAAIECLDGLAVYSS